MPFTSASAHKHKKGLDSTQARKWSAIANGIRSQCLEMGRSESSCDASAIRIANSKVGGTRSSK